VSTGHERRNDFTVQPINISLNKYEARAASNMLRQSDAQVGYME